MSSSDAKIYGEAGTGGALAGYFYFNGVLKLSSAWPLTPSMLCPSRLHEWKL